MALILATASYLGESFDDARLDTLFLTMPISWKGTLQQYVGRLRLHENKKEVRVYDYADVLVPMLARIYKKRLVGYSALGYAVHDGPPQRANRLLADAVLLRAVVPGLLSNTRS